MKDNLKTVTVVIPALNEEKGIGLVIKSVPIEQLKKIGYKTEIVVVDNNSTDNTGKIARDCGAKVVVAPLKGYGNAYKVGFAEATGDIIATGDADSTYSFAVLPKFLVEMEKQNLDFINADRLINLDKTVMTKLHQIGNRLLTLIAKWLFGLPFNDSQSGMWIFKRSIWKSLNVKSSGMAFSQELKIEVFIHGWKWAEIPIDYQARKGKKKLNTVKNGLENIIHLFGKKISVMG